MATHRRTGILARVALSCVLFACGGEQQSTLPSEPVESGFILADNAFSFKNFGGRDPNARVTADSASRMFGVDAVCSNASVAETEGCRLTPIAKTWMQHVNDSMEGGRCEGFAVLSGLMFLGQMTPQDFGSGSVRELSLEDNQALAREIAYWFSTQYLVDVIDKATKPVTANEAVKFLAKELAAPKEMYRLGLVRVDDDGRRRGGHAVLPTAVVPGENGNWKIKVYDNNFPDAEREILVDTAKNRWEYQASSNPNEPLTLYWGSPENGNLMFLSAVTPRLGTHPCLFCAGDETQQAQALAQVFTLGSAEVIAESDGGFAGVLNGRLVNGIVGARIPQMFTNGDNSMMMLVPVGSGVNLRVRDGEGERPMEVGVFGPGFSAGFGDSKKVSDRADRLAVTADGSDFRFEPSTTTGPSISMARVTKAGTQTVVKLKLPEGLPVTSVSMQVDPETGDAGIQARAEGDVALQVEVTRSTADGEDTFEAEIVAPAQGAVQIEVSAWEGEGAPMPVAVDEEGNGNFEQTEVASTGPVGVAPEGPTGFAGVFEDGKVKLTWNDVSANEESFVIERDAGGGFETLAAVGFNSSGASDANVGAGKTYGYRVRAENRYGASAWSEVVWVQIPGCGAGLQDKDGDGVCAPDCSQVQCGAHGACSDASGVAVCACDAGYEGARCERCSLGFQDNDGDGVCAKDCASSGVQCGAHGACSDAGGAATCVCQNGYAGANCEACATGWQDNDGDGVCAMNCASSGIQCGAHGACSDAGGAATCVCQNGYAGANCEACATGWQDNDGDGVCAMNCASSGIQCGAHGACSDAGGAATCVCQNGYAGANCEACAAGWQDNDGDGVCAMNCASSGIQCGAHGACSDAGGAATCVCQNGYAGANCETCATGWQDNDGDGVCAMNCASSGIGCGDHGACADGSGAAVCACDIGYAGASCETCANGYQDHDNNGLCAPTCATSGIGCGDHGDCTDTSGAALCACDTGYAGTSCETCSLGHQDNDGDGICAPDCATASLDCGDHGSCADTSGAALCDCELGYDGPACETCSLGFQDNDGDGLCAPTCATANLDCGANGTCADADGAAFCVCEPGHTGAACDTCDTGYIAGAGGCVLAPARCESSRDCVVELTVPSTLELHQAALTADGLGLVANTVGFANSGTFTVPDGVTSLTVYALGGGGGGRNDFGGPGGGGGAARSVLEVTPGQEVTFTVGAGGLGGWTPTVGGDTVVTVGATTVVGGGGRTPGLAPNPSSGQVVVAGGVNGAAGGDTDGVCSAGSGAQSIDEGLNKHRVGAPGGCFPAGAGGNGAAQYGEVVTDMHGGIGYLKQPGGNGHTYGGGGGSGGNYGGPGGNGGGGYVQFAWEASPPTYATGLWAVAAAVGLQHDTSGWYGISRVTPVTDATIDELAFAVSFDGRTTYKAFVAGAWRTIVRAISTDGAALVTHNTRWQLNTAAAGAETFVNCASNTRAGCLQEAFTHEANRMADLVGVSSPQWASGFVAGTLDFAVGVRSADPSRSPSVERLEIDVARGPEGLAHCWAGENDGTDSYGDVDATVHTDVGYAAGVNGQAFVCSGQNALNRGVAASAKPVISSTGPWTYDFWIKVEQSNNAWVFDRMVPGNPLVSMSVGSNGNASWLIRFDNGQGINSPGFTLSNVWTHLAVTRANGVISFYKDGVLVGTIADPGHSLTPDPPKWCGHYSASTQWMLGQFDTVRIWSRALSAEEIAHSAAGNGSCEAH